MIKKLKNEWGELSPKVRFAIRTFAIGVITYLVRELGDGDIDSWQAVFDAVKTAAVYAFAGLLTPLEPFVGLNKPDVVAVPSPPAVNEDLV